jgi:hypothetical protein
MHCTLGLYDAGHGIYGTLPYRGDLPGFLRFLTEKWGWKVEFYAQSQVITADENKPACVCPIVQRRVGPVSEILCYCSEGFAGRMFSAVTGKAVTAQVVRSVLRGDASCVYRVELG